MTGRIEKDYDLRNLPRFVFICKPLIYNAFLSSAAGDLLSWLCGRFDYRYEQKKVDRFGFFPCRYHEVRRSFYTKSDKPMQRQFNELSKLGIIEIKMKGQPAKRHIRINLKKLEEYVSRGGRSSTARQGQTSTALLLRNSVRSEVSEDTSLPDKRNACRVGMGLVDSSNGTHIDEMADKIYSTIKETGKLPKGSKRSTWIKTLEYLIKLHGLDEVTEIVEWYCANINNRYTPKSYIGRFFKSNYSRMLERMREQNPQVQITKSTSGIANRLVEYLNWPDRKQLETAIQLSYNNIHEIIRPIRLLRDNGHDRIIKGWAERTNIMETEFVVQHMERVHARLSRSGKWDTLIQFHIWKADDKWLNELTSELPSKQKKQVLKELPV